MVSLGGIERTQDGQLSGWLLPKLTRVFATLLMTESPLPCKVPKEYRRGRPKNLDVTDRIGAEVPAVLREL